VNRDACTRIPIPGRLFRAALDVLLDFASSLECPGHLNSIENCGAYWLGKYSSKERPWFKVLGKTVLHLPFANKSLDLSPFRVSNTLNFSDAIADQLSRRFSSPDLTDRKSEGTFSSLDYFRR